MRDKEIIGLWEAYNSIYDKENLDEQIGVPYDGTPEGAAKTLGGLIKRQGLGNPKDVVVPTEDPKKPKLQNAHYEPEGQVIGENEIDIYDEVLNYLIGEGYSEEESRKIMVEGIINNQIQNLRNAAQMFRYMTGIDRPPIKPPAGPANLGNIALRKPAPPSTPKPRFQIGTPSKPTPTVRPSPASSGFRPGVAGTLAAVSRLQGDTPQSGPASRTMQSMRASGSGQYGRYAPAQSHIKPIGPRNPEQGMTKSQSFDKAYARAKQTGGMGSTFTWNNKNYKVY